MKKIMFIFVCLGLLLGNAHSTKASPEVNTIQTNLAADGDAVKFQGDRWRYTLSVRSDDVDDYIAVSWVLDTQLRVIGVSGKNLCSVYDVRSVCPGTGESTIYVDVELPFTGKQIDHLTIVVSLLSLKYDGQGYTEEHSIAVQPLSEVYFPRIDK